MGIERLNNAAHAAGFAMAGDEESFHDRGVHAQVAAAQRQSRWQPSRALLVRETTRDKAAWTATFLALFGRRAPASPV